MKPKDNRVTKIDPNYKEIRKLDALLTEAGIPHTFQTLYWNNTGDLRGAQIIYPEDGPNRVADVIITGASYGNEFDLLEMMGLVPETAKPPGKPGGVFILPVKQSQPGPDRHHPTPYGTSSRRPAGSHQRQGLPASGRP